MAERVYCLYRVSTTKQLDATEQKQPDIPVQRKACREFADKMGWIIAREEQENGVSGFKLSAVQRDKLQLIREHAEKGLFDILLVFMFDRIGRREEETPFVVEWFVEHGIRVWSVVEGEQRFDSHTDYLLNYIRYWQASGESKKTSIRTKTALAQMVLEGRFRGGQTPYGYRLEKSGTVNKHKREINKLVVEDTEADVVRLMFDLCVNYGYGRCRIARKLTELGIRNRKGENWHEATVGAILHNVLYTGVLRSGTSYSQHFEELRITDQRTFDLAQKQMAERSNEQKAARSVPLNTTGQSLLSGNIFCGHCGGRLVLTTNTVTLHGKNGGEEKKTRIRYICYNKTRHRSLCAGQTGYTMHRIDAIVSAELLKTFQKILEPDNWGTIIKNAESDMGKLKMECEAARVHYAEAAQTSADLKQQTEQFMKSNEAETNMAYEFLLARFQDMEKAKKRHDELTDLLQIKMDDLNKLKTFHEDVAIWYRIFDICGKERQKMIVARTLLRVDVYRDYRIEITYQKEAQDAIRQISNTPK